MEMIITKINIIEDNFIELWAIGTLDGNQIVRFHFPKINMSFNEINLCYEYEEDRLSAILKRKVCSLGEKKVFFEIEVIDENEKNKIKKEFEFIKDGKK